MSDHLGPLSSSDDASRQSTTSSNSPAKESGMINLDARALMQLCHKLTMGGVFGNEDMLTLQRAARNLESMDAKIARNIEGTFVDGELHAEARARARSNILQSPGRKFTNSEGETVISAFAPDKIKKIARGLSGLPKPKRGETIDITTVQSAPARKGFRLEDL